MILILDTETTGLPKDMNAPYNDTVNWPHMLSIAWEAYYRNGRVEKAAYIVEPRAGVVNSPQALAVNKITPEMQEREGVEMKVIMFQYRMLVTQAEMVVAHNVQFDRGIIGAELARLNTGEPPAKWLCTKQDIGNLLNLPPSEAQRKYRPEIQYKEPKLDELYQFLFGMPVPGREESHGARQDAAACAECFWELRKRGLI